MKFYGVSHGELRTYLKTLARERPAQVCCESESSGLELVAKGLSFEGATTSIFKSSGYEIKG